MIEYMKMERFVFFSFTAIIIICILIFASISGYIFINNKLCDDEEIIGDHANHGPVSHFKMKQNPDDPLDVIFYLRGSFDIDGDNITYYIRFGDGLSLLNFTEDVVNHTYMKYDEYSVILWVIDEYGAGSSSTSYTINLTKYGNQTPYLIVDDKITMYISKQPVNLSAYHSFDVDGEIVNFIWEFGDGTFSDKNCRSSFIHHEYDYPGSYDATVTAVDDDGFTTSETIRVVLLASC